MFIESPFLGYPTSILFTHGCLVVNDALDSKNNKEEKTREVADMRIITLVHVFLDALASLDLKL